MARNIFIVDASLVNGEGQYSQVSVFPKRFDSESYSGNAETALRRAKSAFFAQASANYAVDGRIMQTVTLEQADGRQIMRDCIGIFPDMTPTPAPEPEPVEGE